MTTLGMYSLVIGYGALGLDLGITELVFTPKYNLREICRTSPYLFVLLNIFLWPVFLLATPLRRVSKIIKSILILLITAGINTYVIKFVVGLSDVAYIDYAAWAAAIIVSIVATQFLDGLFGLGTDFAFVLSGDE